MDKERTAEDVKHRISCKISHRLTDEDIIYLWRNVHSDDYRKFIMDIVGKRFVNLHTPKEK